MHHHVYGHVRRLVPATFSPLLSRLVPLCRQNSTSWVLTTAAALYWRVRGDGPRAASCLRVALHHAPRHLKDIPLISLANILHRSVLRGSIYRTGQSSTGQILHRSVNRGSIYYTGQSFAGQYTTQVSPPRVNLPDRSRSVNMHRSVNRTTYMHDCPVNREQTAR